mgnify:CR=1 FL=1
MFGGTFDPVHEVHLEVARQAADQFGLDEVLFVAAAHPPHKTGATLADYEDRYRMVELACQIEPRLTASRLEAGEGKSYSIDTIRRLRDGLEPGDEIFFLIGADAFAEIASWHRWREVVEAVQFIVVSRPGHTYDIPAGARVHRLETVASPVSSSEIRAKLAAGEDPPELPTAVSRYIRERGLYGARR